MTPMEIADYLRGLADATIVVAESQDTNRVSRARLQMQASVLLEAVDTLLRQSNDVDQLRDRLVRQACWFEQFEARAQPKSWPLLDEGDDEDPSLAL